jgi:prepilin-type processing-associated H-X9-DG protein
MIIAAQVVTVIGSYYTTMTCGEVAYIQRDDLAYLQTAYPGCVAGTESLQTVVHVSFADGHAEEIGASLRLNFGMGLWLAFFLHAVGVEVYLRLTPRESERLRQVSYERQLEAGMDNPGSAGLVVERFGDADTWLPTTATKDRTEL